MSGIPIFHSRYLPVPTADNMRKIIGRESDSVTNDLLSQVLRSNSNQLHWSVNSFLRLQLMNEAADFNICSSSKIHSSSSSRVTVSCSADTRGCLKSNSINSFPSKLPNDILFKVLQYLDLRSLMNLSGSSAFFRGTIVKPDEDNGMKMRYIWTDLLIHLNYICTMDCGDNKSITDSLSNKRVVASASGTSIICEILMIGGCKLGAGSRTNYSNYSGSMEANIRRVYKIGSAYYYCIYASSSDPPDEDPSDLAQDEYSFDNNYDSRPDLSVHDVFSLLKECYRSERSRACLHCHMNDSVIVPVVYGFPSDHLMQCQARRRLVFGGDYLLPGSASWTCLHCKFEFYTYPYWCSTISVEMTAAK